ncbi:MAG: ATP-dependent zinc protease family protein [Marinicella sp.]
MTEKNTIKVGWKEYAALPELGVERIHVKIDTGAKTSAIHTLKNKLYLKGNQQWVKFTLAPHQDDDDTTIDCDMPVKDQRIITSSNGHRSERIVIETLLVIGNSERLIEVTLVCRRKMKFRMLIGRQAMQDMEVIPKKAHLTTKNKRK